MYNPLLVYDYSSYQIEFCSFLQKVVLVCHQKYKIAINVPLQHNLNCYQVMINSFS